MRSWILNMKDLMRSLPGVVIKKISRFPICWYLILTKTAVFFDFVHTQKMKAQLRGLKRSDEREKKILFTNQIPYNNFPLPVFFVKQMVSIIYFPYQFP